MRFYILTTQSIQLALLVALFEKADATQPSVPAQVVLTLLVIVGAVSMFWREK